MAKAIENEYVNFEKVIELLDESLTRISNALPANASNAGSKVDKRVVGKVFATDKMDSVLEGFLNGYVEPPTIDEIKAASMADYHYQEGVYDEVDLSEEEIQSLKEKPDFDLFLDLASELASNPQSVQGQNSAIDAITADVNEAALSLVPLQSTVLTWQKTIHEPLRKYKEDATLQSRLHSVTTALQHASNIYTQCNSLEQLLTLHELKRVKALEDKYSHLQKASTTDREGLKRALRSQARLDSLIPMVSKVYAALKKSALHSIKDVIKAADPLKTATLRAAEMTPALTQMYSHLSKVLTKLFFLQTSLHTERDPETYESLSTLVGSNYKKAIPIWRDIMKEVAKAFSTIINDDPHESPLLLQFPAILQMHEKLANLAFKEVSAAQDIISGNSNVALECRNVVWEAVVDMEQKYIARSISRATDPVNLALPVNSLVSPTMVDCGAVAKAMLSELAAAKSSHRLLDKAVRSVEQAITLFASRCNDRLSTSLEDLEPNATGTGATLQRHIDLVICCLDLQSKISAKMATVPTLVSDRLQKPLQLLTDFVHSSISPVIQAANNSFATQIAGMHSESFAASRPPASGHATFSKYLVALRKRVETWATTVFKPALQQPCVLEARKKLASSLIATFIVSASMIRPLGDGGRLKLTADIVEFEPCMQPILPPSIQLSSLPEYKSLRELRRFMYFDLKEITEASPTTPLPSVAVFSLALSRVPSDFPSMYQALSMTVAKMPKWLEKRPLSEVHGLCRKVLTIYARKVHSSGLTEYHDAYPVLDALLKTLEERSVTPDVVKPPSNTPPQVEVQPSVSKTKTFTFPSYN